MEKQGTEKHPLNVGFVNLGVCFGLVEKNAGAPLDQPPPSETLPRTGYLPLLLNQNPPHPPHPHTRQPCHHDQEDHHDQRATAVAPFSSSSFPS